MRDRFRPGTLLIEQARSMPRGGPTPEQLADLEPQLRYLLNRWDPIGVYDEVEDYPPDEYDCLLAPLLRALARGDTATELGEFLWFEIEDHFGLDPHLSRPDLFAAKIVAWYQATTR